MQEPDMSVTETKLNYKSLALSIVLVFVFLKTKYNLSLILKAIGMYSYKQPWPKVEKCHSHEDYEVKIS